MASQTEMEAVYRLHIGAVYRLCYSYLGSAAKAEDAAQAVFLSLVEHPRTFNDAEHEKAWLIVCAQTLPRCDEKRSLGWLSPDEYRRSEGWAV